MTFKKLIATSALGLAMTIAQASSGGFQLDRSRVLFEDGKRNVSYGISNHYDAPALASAVVTNYDGTPTHAFAVSPSIFQIPPNSTSRGQIVQLEQLPQDRETVFWLNVKTVLSNSKAKTEEQDSTIEFALGQRIKLFYRPKGLDEKCSGAVEKLRWEKTETGLKLINPSKVSMSVVNVKSGSKIQKINDVVLPLSEKEWIVDTKGWGKITFCYVDELGNYIDVPLNLQ